MSPIIKRSKKSIFKIIKDLDKRGIYHLVDQIVGIVINGVILYYPYRPGVKAYFGKSKPSTTIPR